MMKRLLAPKAFITAMVRSCSFKRAKSVLWMPKRRVSEQGTDGSKPRIAGAHAVLSLLFQVVEEGADQRSIKIVDIQLAWGIAFPV